MDYARRLRGLQEAMNARGVDLLVCGACPSYQYLTGLGPGWRESRDSVPVGDAVLVPRTGAPILTAGRVESAAGSWIRDVRPLGKGQELDDVLRGVVADLGGDARTIGLGRHLPAPVVIALTRAAGGARFVDGSELLDGVRMVKDSDEVELLRRAARLTDRVMETVVRDIREGVTQRELDLAIEMQARRLGASHVSFPPVAGFVKSGSTATDPLASYPENEGLTANAAIFFDVGFVLDGYCSDWGRSVYWGNPPAHAVRGHEALREAVLETVGAMRAGVTRACDVYPAMEKVLDRLGYGDQLRARLAPSNVMGHQIGVEVHENPWLRPGNTQPLQEGMVLCVEPKLWHPGEYYFRLEEMVLIKSHGAELLTNFDRELFRL